MPNPDPSYRNAQERKQVDDLHWCLHSPELLHPEYLRSIGAECYIPPNPQLKPLTVEIALISPHKRLGLYFEQLWQALVCTYFNQEIVAANQQITLSGVTLGALDLLTYCAKQKRYIHYELAIKFYLQTENGVETKDWVGPNSHDRLDIKLARLLNHQLPLLHKVEVQNIIEGWVKKQGTPDFCLTQTQQQLILKGWLFRHFSSRPITGHHDFLNTRCPQGTWGRFNEVAQWYERSKKDDRHWLILPKLYWLAPINIHMNGVETLNKTELETTLYLQKPIMVNNLELLKLLLAQQCNENAQALLIAEVHLLNMHWIEQQRILWVKNDWPQSTTRSALPSRNK